MLNIYDFVVNNTLYKKFVVDELLFIEYKCLFPEEKTLYWTSNNYFVYVLGGRKKFYYGDTELEVHGGDSVFVKRGVYVAQRFQEDDFCALVIFIPDHFIESVVKKYASLNAAAPRSEDTSNAIIRLNLDESFAVYFQSVLSYFGKSVSPPRELLTIKFEELVLSVLTSPGNQELSTYFHSISQGRKSSVREVMERTFMHNMSIDEYARLCARSVSSFKADFFDTYKTTPGKWLITKRLEYARLLLQTTDEAVGVVAEKCGFKNASHFVKSFRDAYGRPPLQYRQVSAGNAEQQSI